MALLWLGFSLAYRLFFGRRLVVETTTERIDSFVDRPEIPDTIFGEPRDRSEGYVMELTLLNVIAALTVVTMCGYVLRWTRRRRWSAHSRMRRPILHLTIHH
jgi:hypothetical protein